MIRDVLILLEKVGSSMPPSEPATLEARQAGIVEGHEPRGNHMPFYAYKLTSGWPGKIVADSPVGVRLAGKRGPFHRHVQPLFPAAQEGVLCWQLDESQMLTLLGISSQDHAIIVDLKPDDPNAVSLYRLRHVWGRSRRKWTPLAVQLEALFVDKPVANIHQFKARFEMPLVQGDLVHEFLYLTGGTEKGSWVWGRNGNVNATLLWPDALSWFFEEIKPFLKPRLKE
jgi:hypothetical protein